jgi:hypothetical protein
MILTFEEEEEYERRMAQFKEEFRNAYLELSYGLEDYNLG